MALDQAYFDAIRIDVVKKKYYNAKKVEAVLEDIRRQALALNEENERLREQMEALRDRKDEIGDTLLSAKTISRQILRDAEEQAGTILADARERSREQLLAGADREEALRRQLERHVQRIRECLLDCAEEIGAEWRAFDDENLSVPEDLESKVGAIARQLFAEAEDEAPVEV